MLLGLSAAFAITEVVLRFTWTPTSLQSTPAVEEHPVYRWAPIPGVTGTRVTPEYTHSFTHTAQGFRGETVFERWSEETTRLRILFLGDSFTYGLGAENDETFVGLLATELAGVDVLNAGANGYGQREELAVLDALGPAFHPNLVVVVFFWNDLEDDIEEGAPTFDLDGAGRVIRTDRPVLADFDPLALRPTPPVGPLSANSPLYYTRELVRERLQVFRHKYWGLAPRDIRTEAELANAWRVTRRLLELVDKRTRELGARLLIVSIPDDNKVDPDAYSKGIEPINFDIEAELAASTSALEIRYLDLFDSFRAARETSQEPLFYYADRHLTPAGNRVVARALSPVLRRELDTPPREDSL